MRLRSHCEILTEFYNCDILRIFLLGMREIKITFLYGVKCLSIGARYIPITFSRFTKSCNEKLKINNKEHIDNVLYVFIAAIHFLYLMKKNSEIQAHTGLQICVHTHIIPISFIAHRY